MAWLSTWAKRRSITISDANIDSNQTHLPVRLSLSTSAGTGSTDISSIFNELGSDGNRTKIAITLGDGTTEIYGEIEKWDDAGESAELWISKSDWILYASATGEQNKLYFYYDDSQSANTAYIGDTNSVVAENVWDANFKGVWHMGDGADNEHIYDSTSNDNDGTKKGVAQPTLTTSGVIGDAQNFNGIDEYITKADTPSLNFGDGDFTLSAFVKLDESGNNRMIISKGRQAGAYKRYFLNKHSTDVLECQIDDNSSLKFVLDTDNISSGWHYVSGVRDGNLLKAYTDGAISGNTTDITGYGDLDEAEPFYLGTVWDGNQTALYYFFVGDMDEVRVSAAARSLDWNKVDFYSVTDALVAWGEEELLGITITPSSQDLTFSVQTPAIVTDAIIGVSEQALTFSVPAYAIVTQAILSPAVQSLTFSIPTVTILAGGDISVSPSAQDITASIPTPIISTEVIISAGKQTLSFSIPAISLSLGLAISPSTQELILSIPTFTILTETIVSPSVQSLAFSIPTASLLLSSTMYPSAQALIFSLPSSVVLPYWLGEGMAIAKEQPYQTSKSVGYPTAKSKY